MFLVLQCLHPASANQQTLLMPPPPPPPPPQHAAIAVIRHNLFLPISTSPPPPLLLLFLPLFEIYNFLYFLYHFCHPTSSCNYTLPFLSF